MTLQGWLQILVYLSLVVLITRPVGAYLYRVFETPRPPMARVLGPLERAIYRLCGIRAESEQTWVGYTGALLIFSGVTLLVTYLIERVQGHLPLNPQHLAAVPPALAFNTAVSFTTNTNWQSYSGELTMSHLTQMAGLAWHNFLSAAVGVGVALCLARGLTRHLAKGAERLVGNFWVDLVRGTLYVLLPLSFLLAIAFVSQGVIQNFAPYRTVQTLAGHTQTIAMGPVASQEAIKELGTNGGGFFNANSAHPFENPTPLSNFLQLLAIFAIPAGLTYTFGRMAKDQRQGWTLFAAMLALCLTGAAITYWAESHPNPALQGIAADHRLGNMEGKEIRFGAAASALFAVVTTDASCGAVNAMHDSFTPLGGLVPLVNIQLGELVFGGVGAGLYAMLVFALLAVFIAGLMVGRTPEYLGKKIESAEMKLAMLYVLIFPLIILGGAAWASVSRLGVSSLANAGPHGLSEMLYAFTSAAGNNGSAFAGLNANTPFWNITLAVTMLVGRFLMIVPALAIAGSMVGKKVVPAGPGTFPTTGPLFTVLLIGTIVIVGALTFFSALTLGPLLEHFLALHGRTF